MRIVALAALFAVVSGETLKHGYGLGNGDLQFDLISGTKTSTRAYSLTLPSWATFNSQSGVSSANWWLSIRLYVSAVDCPQCAAQTIDLHSRIGATAATAADPKILDKAGGTALGTSGIWADIPLPALTSGDQTVQFFINITCSACRNSAELSRLEAIVRNVDKSLPAASQMVVFGSFDRDNDRNTDQFSGSVGSWGPVVRIPAITATDYVIVVQEIAALSSGSGIVYYFSTNQTGFATGITTYDAATLACASATTGSGCASVTFFTTPPAGSQFWRAPSSSYTTGEFPAAPSNLGSLSAGTWYVAPFITKKGAGTSSPAYRFAIGFNAVPAAAAGLVPSFVVVALATVFAALRV